MHFFNKFKKIQKGRLEVRISLEQRKFHSKTNQPFQPVMTDIAKFFDFKEHLNKNLPAQAQGAAPSGLTENYNLICETRLNKGKKVIVIKSESYSLFRQTNLSLHYTLNVIQTALIITMKH